MDQGQYYPGQPLPVAYGIPSGLPSAKSEEDRLREEVARLKKTRAAVVKALETESWDDVRAALAHSESSTKRVYSRRGMTDDEKKAHNRSMFSEEAYAFCERLYSDEVPVSSFHKKLDEAGYKPLHTSSKFTVRIVEQVFGDWKQAKGGARPVEKSAAYGKQWHEPHGHLPYQDDVHRLLYLYLYLL